VHRFPETSKGFGKTFIPKGQFQCQRKGDGVRTPSQKVTDAAFQGKRPFPHIRKSPLGRHPKHAAGIAQDRLARAEKDPTPAHASGSDAKKAQTSEESVLFEGFGVDRGEVVSSREQVAEDETDERIPPRGMVQDDDHWLLRQRP
jgi:hypothetical protein